jgi:1-acyl-sn-glycerol-3-phosphate acyltransferase
MYKPYSTPIAEAYPNIKAPQPRISKPIVFLIRLLARLYLFIFLGIARLVMPRVGAMPIHHTKLDSKGMVRIFQSLKNGPYPLAIAPEGQVTYNTEQVLNLEQGAIRIGFHAADQLSKEGQPYPVEALPVSIHLRYGIWGKMCLSRLMDRLDRATGFRARYKEDLLKAYPDCIEEANKAVYSIWT